MILLFFYICFIVAFCVACVLCKEMSIKPLLPFVCTFCGSCLLGSSPTPFVHVAHGKHDKSDK